MEQQTKQKPVPRSEEPVCGQLYMGGGRSARPRIIHISHVGKQAQRSQGNCPKVTQLVEADLALEARPV